ncbi:PREDICTED: protein NIM1-INTERACTING 2-like [Tarenaya hassleriana]|uniref:protein NIM1-INTERACTING 2-like n=1 Tax=Tarenaya hassleriana TaxID=28532 RepID=UPI00053CA728|nr:PREDICTED: protein NIM1-INTERACTING 2-like [Tarenaya hassleriana]
MSPNGETESERKRKREEEGRSQNDVASGSVNSHGGGGDGGGSTATVEDREVDEFFAILRRMHTAVNNLKKAEGVNGVSPVLTERGAVRSGRDANGVSVDPMVRGRDVVAENGGLGFDLNADPVPESDPV